MKTHAISLLDIAGEINEDTPLIVLEEICDAHDIDISYFNSQNVTRYIINTPFSTPEDQINASKLINKNVAWNQDDLANAFEFISLFYERPFYSSDNTDFGLSTPTNMFCYNSSMCYRLLKEKKLTINKFCNFRELASAVLIAYGHPSYGRTIIYSFLSEMSSEDLSSVYLYGLNKKARLEEPYNEDFSSSDEDVQEGLDETVYSGLQTIAKFYEDERFVFNRINPCTNVEAIYLAATNFETDISDAKNHIEEYDLLRQNPYNYIPKDLSLKKLLQKSPYILKLNYFFNPYLPAELYLETSLRSLAKFEGYREEDLALEDSYSLLQTSCFSDTFHTGVFFNVKNTLTLEYEDVMELSINVLVYFGNPRETVYAFRLCELDKNFRRERCYKNPIDGSLFSALSIRKLKNICSLIYPNDTEESYLERRALVGTIDFIEIYNAGDAQKLKELYEIFEVSTHSEQEDIRMVVVSLMELGMYMRGWEGEGEYPIELCIVRNQVNTDLFVTTAINDFENLCDDLGGTGVLIRNLPLLRFVRGHFIPSNNNQEGKTIQERINIVKAGEMADTFFSCIRLTSNWVCATAYRIMQVLRIVPTFNIEKLREIS